MVLQNKSMNCYQRMIEMKVMPRVDKNKVENTGKQIQTDTNLERHGLYAKESESYLRLVVVHLEAYVLCAKPDFR